LGANSSIKRLIFCCFSEQSGQLHRDALARI
jgi:hypothetical protein